MDKETAERKLGVIREQMGLLENCIEHATSNRDALDRRSTLLAQYDTALEELKREERDYELIISYK